MKTVSLHLNILHAVLAATSLSVAAGAAAANPVKAPTEKSAETDSVATPSYNLDELVVEGKKPLITVADGTVHYNVKEDPASGTSSVIDMLRKLPGVTVDGNDKIRLNGQEGFTIQINGVENPAITQNAGMILKNMPAAMVTRIEIISEPGAKYDAEGVGGIINIVTETKQNSDGYNVNLSMTAAKMSTGASAYGRMKYGKFSAGAHVDYYHNLAKQHSEVDNSMEFLTPDGAVASRQKYQGEFNSRFGYLGAGLDFSYQPDDANLFVMNLDLNNVSPDVDARQSDLSAPGADGEFVNTMDEMSKIKMRNLNLTGAASYQHTFAPDHYLVVNYKYVFGRSITDSHIHYLPVANDFAAYDVRNFSGNYTRENTGQIDYNLPLADGKHTIGLGAKAIFRHNTGLGSLSDNIASEEMVPSENGESDFLQKQQIEAAYVTYKGLFGPWIVSAGVRYEHTHTSMAERAGEKHNFSGNLDDVVPNASITWQRDAMKSLRLNYQMRISRPSISQLNPFAAMPVFGTYMSVGNPDLTSEKSHIATITWSAYGVTTGYSLALEYRRLNGMICTMPVERDGRLYFTPFNIGHQDRPQFSANFYWNVTPNFMLSVNGAVNYTYLQGFGTSNSCWSGNYNLYANYNFPHDITLNAYGGQNLRSVDLNVRRSGNYFYGLGLSKKFLKEKQLKVNLSLMNFLTPHLSVNNRTWSDAYRNVLRNKINLWNVGVSVEWSFGSKSNLKNAKVNSEINNDDASRSSGSPIGGMSGGAGSSGGN